mmetsp:Transcript_9016/g.21701  ORF Transcript_9016/g.21701 Transcript_9016/m.21701 type:complete len:218 (+) Transcript_9016:414-1067(+)
MVGSPELIAKPCTPRYPKLGFMVSIVRRRVEDRWLPVHRCNVPAPQVTVQDAGLHLDAFEEAVELGAQLLPHGHELPVPGEAELVHEPLVAEEGDPVLPPGVGLARAPAGVVDGEAELPGGRVGVRRLGEVHSRQQTAELPPRRPPPQVEVLHDDEAPGCAKPSAAGDSAAQGAVVINLGDAQRVRLVHCSQCQCLALEHANIPAERKLHKEFASVL